MVVPVTVGISEVRVTVSKSVEIGLDEAMVSRGRSGGVAGRRARVE